MPRPNASRKIRSLRSIVGSPALPALIQSLAPRELAQLCSRIGVADAMQIMALAPIERLVQALEASVWKTPRPGLPEVFDARELVEWIGTWLEIGEAFTAERLAAVPDDHLMLYLSQLATVTTAAMWGFERSSEIGDLERVYAPSHEEKAYGPYIARARQPKDWETLRGALDALWSQAPERLLNLFSQLSGDESMLRPQQNRESSNDDVVFARESVRERQGYVTAAGARAFLAVAANPLAELAAMSEYDPETRRHLERLVPHLSAEAPDSVAIARARDHDGGRMQLAQDLPARRLRIVTLLQALAEENAMVFDVRARELAYLSSVLIAGASVAGSALKPAEAQGAALATCSLGLETLTSSGRPIGMDREPGLVRLFLMGRNVLSTLPSTVVDAFAHRLERLKQARSEPLHEWLVEQAEDSVTALREAVGKADFEEAREAAMALCFVFEPRLCRAVMPLLDELPQFGTADGGAASWIDSLAAVSRAVKLLRRIRDGKPQ